MTLRKGVWLIGGLLLLTGCMQSVEDKNSPKNQERNMANAAMYNVQMGILYYQKGDVTRARQKLLQAEKQAPDSSSVLDAMGYFLEMTGEPQRAKGYYLRALTVAPHDGNVLNNYGAFLCRQRDYARAQDYFMQAVNDPNYVTPAEAYENAGLCALSIPDEVRAEAYFIKALQRQPSQLNSLLEMSRISYNKKAYAVAKMYMEQYTRHSGLTADSVLLSIKIGQKLGDTKWVASSVLLLKNRFADSEEYRAFMASSEGKSR